MPLSPLSVKNALWRELKNRFFQVVVDLGCGSGDLGRILRPHARYLIGVDISEELLNKAAQTGYYDELVLSDIRNYYLPSETDLVVLIEVIEHMPHEDGEKLLQSLYRVPNIILSTPARFYPALPKMPHISLWSETQLQEYGFKTKIISTFFIFDPTIFATR